MTTVTTVTIVTWENREMVKAAEACVRKGIPFGCVTIAERHLKKGTEHLNLKRKSAFGAEWFISQASAPFALPGFHTVWWLLYPSGWVAGSLFSEPSYRWCEACLPSFWKRGR
jgi:hypothetical protein